MLAFFFFLTLQNTPCVFHFTKCSNLASLFSASTPFLVLPHFSSHLQSLVGGRSTQIVIWMDSRLEMLLAKPVTCKGSPPPSAHSEHSGVARLVQNPWGRSPGQPPRWFQDSLSRLRTRPSTPTSARNSGPRLPVQAPPRNSSFRGGSLAPKAPGPPQPHPRPRAPSSRHPGPQASPLATGSSRRPAPSPGGRWGRRAGASPGFLPP